MALTVEDGTGVSGADSYDTLASCIQYAEDYYGKSLTGSTDDKEASMRRAFAYLNGLKWNGSRTNGRAQGGAWPRTGMVDCDGNAIASDEIPAELKQAQHELARAEFLSPGVLSPQGSMRDNAVSMEKVDVIAVEYDTSKLGSSPDVAQVIVSAAMRKISCYLANGGRVGVTEFQAYYV